MGTVTAAISPKMPENTVHEHLGEINEQADSMFSQLVKQLAEQQGITEALKAENQLLWVQQMNNVQNVAAEIVLNELIYC